MTARPATITPDPSAARALARSSRYVATVPVAATERTALERLDDALVPGLQRGARSMAGVLGRPLRGLRAVEDRVAGGLVDRLRRSWRLASLVAVSIAVAGSAIHFDRYADLQQADADRRAAAEEQSLTRPGAPARQDSPDGAVEVLGPTVGDDTAAYVAERGEALAQVPAGDLRVAVVSFREYLTGEEILTVLPEGTGVHAAQLRIPAVGEQPFQTEVVDGDLLSSIARALDAPLTELDAERRQLAELIDSGTVTDREFLADYRQRVEEIDAIRNTLNSGAGTVFSLLVQASGAALHEMAGHELVRLVDVAPQGTDGPSAGFYGLLPEDAGRITHGRPG